MEEITLHSTQPFEQSLNKINYLILTVTFKSPSIPIFDGLRSYFSKAKNNI
jgi:hypothetical protein